MPPCDWLYRAASPERFALDPIEHRSGSASPPSKDGAGRSSTPPARLGRAGLLALIGLLLGTSAALAAEESVLDRQAAAYRLDAPKTILDLQPFRQTEQVPGASLIDLSPQINRWFLLTIDGAGSDHKAYHLENPDPVGQQIHLGEGVLHIAARSGPIDCPLTGGPGPTPLQAAQRSALPYAPLCDGHLYLRNRVSGRSSALERVTDLLRDHIWGGDQIVNLVRDEFYVDRFVDRGVQATAAGSAAPDSVAADAPSPAQMRAPVPGEHPVVPSTLAIPLDRPAAGGLVQGRWYPATGLPGVQVSFVQPERVAPDGIERGALNPMDASEASALVYLVAFDLSQFDLGFALGTDHPRVGWSDRPPENVRGNLPGPDGIEHVAPLVVNGMVSPWLAPRTAAAFTGGFKREHGAFKYGDFAEHNHGTHYGFIQDGTIFSKLWPGLSTLYVLDDGTIEMKTWREQDDALLPRIVDARQNGVPLIEYDPETKRSAPGALVPRWGPGNWAASAEEKLRTVRAGICMQDTETRRFLIYGYFSTSTPSAMARVFQAYHCHYAMHLDMNALEHTYLAVYRHDGAALAVEHLVNGMAAIDPESDDGTTLPRFLEVPDDRDLFYLTRRTTAR